MPKQSILGTGWGYPPTFFEGGAGIQMVSDEEDVQQSLHILLATQLGERVMREDFGCDLNSVMFEEIDQGLLNRLNRVITNAILYFEARITLNDLIISDSQSQEGLLLIQLDYTIRSTNSRFNLVYPFYINEATIPGV